jgi:mannose-6-phosphate isomerase-like protein (cupin superfamily)
LKSRSLPAFQVKIGVGRRSLQDRLGAEMTSVRGCPAFGVTNYELRQPKQGRSNCGGRINKRAMGDKSITKVSSATAPRGAMGQKYLASGIRVSMRLWEEGVTSDPKEATTADYETVGYVIAGRAQLHLEGQRVLLEPGDSWIVPKGSSHRYSILEDFTAVEATSPPAEIHGRDEHRGVS